jgi:hypothetical protein
MIIKRITLIVALIFAATSLYGQSAEDIIQKNLDKRGNTKLGEVTSIKVKASISSPRMPFDVPIMYYYKDGMMRQEQEIQGKKVYRIYDGSNLWMKNEMQGDINFKKSDQKVNEEQIKRMVDFVMGPFYDIDDSTTFDYLGLVDEDGEQYHKIQLFTPEMEADTNNTKIFIYLDGVSYLTSHYSIFQDAEGKENKTKIIFEDYGKSNGVIHPQYIEIEANGQTQIEYEFEEVEINGEVDDLLFIPQ